MLVNIVPICARRLDDLFVADTGKSIKGKVTKLGFKFPCRVTLLEHMTDRLIAQVLTDNQGNYEFKSLSAGFEFTLIAHDHDRQYNAVIQDNVVPK